MTKIYTQRRSDNTVKVTDIFFSNFVSKGDLLMSFETSRQT